MKTLTISTSKGMTIKINYAYNIGHQGLEIKVQSTTMQICETKLNLQILLAPDGFM